MMPVLEVMNCCHSVRACLYMDWCLLLVIAKRGVADGHRMQRRAGIVLSHAPMMGADPVIDESHNRWLHIHVRPPVTGMLKVRGCRILPMQTTTLSAYAAA